MFSIFAVSSKQDVIMVIPYKDQESGKKQQVESMFDSISTKYDFLNHFLSGGIDILWRKKAISILKKEKPIEILDIATGTGDFAIEALNTGAKKITGLDLSEGMLKIGREKINKKGLSDRIELVKGDSENLFFSSDSFDAVTASFGVRNFENLEKGLSEMRRVLKPGGTMMILEFSKPKSFPFKQLYHFYFKNILPLIGRMVSKDKSAYTYLPESVKHFPDGEDFLKIMQKVGFQTAKCKTLTFGICSIYTGKK